MLEYEAKGEWWLPVAPDRRLSGELSFNQADGAVLETTGHLIPIAGGINEVRGSPSVHGLARNGKSISLLGCIVSNIGLNYPGLPSQSLRSEYLLVGKHVDSLDGQWVDRARIFVGSVFRTSRPEMR